MPPLLRSHSTTVNSLLDAISGVPQRQAPTEFVHFRPQALASAPPSSLSSSSSPSTSPPGATASSEVPGRHRSISMEIQEIRVEDPKPSLSLALALVPQEKEEKRRRMREKLQGAELTNAERKCLIEICQRDRTKRQVNLGN